MLETYLGTSVILAAISLFIGLILFLAVIKLFPISHTLVEIRDLLKKSLEQKAAGDENK